MTDQRSADFMPVGKVKGKRVAGYGLLVAGYWLLVTGYWLLVTGYWLLVICQ